MPHKDQAKRREYHKQWVANWRAKDPIAAREYDRQKAAAWRARNPEYYTSADAKTAGVARMRAWRAANPKTAKENARRSAANYRAANPEKYREKQRNWCRANKEKIRDAMLRRTYGLSLADYKAMVLAQGGVCAICSSLPGRPHNALYVDHDHLTGAVRSLLCQNCNVVLGHAKEDADRLRKCADYIERHRALLEIV